MNPYRSFRSIDLDRTAFNTVRPVRSSFHIGSPDDHSTIPPQGDTGFTAFEHDLVGSLDLDAPTVDLHFQLLALPTVTVFKLDLISERFVESAGDQPSWPVVGLAEDHLVIDHNRESTSYGDPALL